MATRPEPGNQPRYMCQPAVGGTGRGLRLHPLSVFLIAFKTWGFGMEVNKIWAVLQNDAGMGDAAAKLEFLQWVLGLPEGVSARDEAAKVLEELPDGAQTRSAEVFRNCLIECTWPVPVTQRRRRRLLH